MIPPAIARVLAIPSPDIQRAVGVKDSTVYCWRKGRRPLDKYADGLCSLAHPDDHAEIRAWCVPAPKPKPPLHPPAVEESQVISVRAPVSLLKGIEAYRKPDETRTDIILDGLVNELARRENADRWGLNATEPEAPITDECLRRVAAADLMGPRDTDTLAQWDRYRALLDKHRARAAKMSDEQRRAWMDRKPHIRVLLGGR